MFLGLVDSVGDPGGDGVPAQLRGVGGVEVVLGVLAGAAVVLDDVLVLVADDDGEIAVLLHPSLPDSLDSAAPPVTVEGNDTVDCIGGEPAGGPEVSRPLIDRCHGQSLARARQNTVGVFAAPGSPGPSVQFTAVVVEERGGGAGALGKAAAAGEYEHHHRGEVRVHRHHLRVGQQVDHAVDSRVADRQVERL